MKTSSRVGYLAKNAIVSLLLTSAVTSRGADCVSPPAGAVSWWRGEGNANDALGANSGLTQGDLTFVAGEVGQAFSLNETNASVMVPASSSLDVGAGNGFTLEAWIKPTTITNLQPLFEWNSGSSVGDAWGVHFYISQDAGPGSLYANIVDSGQGWHWIKSTNNPVVANVFQHVALTYDKASGIATFYHNGNIVGQQSMGSFTPKTTYDLYLGRRITAEKFGYKGLIDEPTVYGRALSQSEIQAIYNADVAGKCLPSNDTNGVPIITSFSPLSATNGTPVTILGQNFSAFAQSNVVYFGAVKATVTSATATSLTVVVPAGATFGPLTVTVNGLTAFSGKLFEPTFAGGGANITSASFAPPFTLASGAAPCRVVIADLDGDGKPDLISANSTDHTLSIYRNISSVGSLTAASFDARVDLSVVATADSPYKVLVADIDGDGKLDILALNRSVNTVSVFRNIATPGTLTTNSFAPRVDFTVGALPLGIAGRDLDGDGRPEIITANYTAATVSVLRNTGSAGVVDSNSFAPAIDYPVGDGAANLVCGDLDGDGKPDIAVDNYNATFISVLRNTSSLGQIDTNSFASRADLPAIINCEGIAIGDLDGDGKLDLITGSSTGGQMLSIYHNTATSGVLDTNSFQTKVDFAAGGRVHTTALGDLNGDGKPDIALTHEINSGMSVFQNTTTAGSFTTGTLAARMDFASGSNPWGVSVGDLDGDGRPDVVFGNAYDNTLTIYRNIVGSPIAPVITQQPTNRSAFVGASVTFNVTATGTAPLRYQWAFNGTNIVGATNNSLVLANVQLTNAGLYSVVITNGGGIAMSSNAVLSVLIPTLADGMLVHYPFDGNALDTSGNSHNGTVVGATLATDRFGSNSCAYSFNGTSSYVIVPDSAKTLTFDARSNRYTVALWVKLSDTSRWQDLLIDRYSLGNGHSSYRLLFHPAYGFMAVCWDGLVNLEVASQTYPVSNQWYHIAMVVNSGIVRLYVNGNQESSPGEPGSALTMPLNFGNTTNNETARTIGRFAGTTYGNYFKGALDDIRIYGRALSTNDIGVLYGGGAPVIAPIVTIQPTNRSVFVGEAASFSVVATGTPPLTYQWKFNGANISGATNSSFFIPNVQLTNAGLYSVLVTNAVGSALSSNGILAVTIPTLDDGMLLHYPFEGNALDTSGNNHTGQVFGATLCPDRFGSNNAAYAFNGQNAYMVVSDSAKALNFEAKSNKYSVALWVKLLDTSRRQEILIDRASLNNQHSAYRLVFVPGYGFIAGCWDGWYNFQVASQTVPQSNQWYHLAVVMDAGTQKLYVNGKAEFAPSEPGVLSTMPADFGSTLNSETGRSIGRFAGTYYGDYLNGALDDIRIYGRALSAADLHQLYVTPPTIVTQPLSRTNSVGTEATFTVTATGTMPIGYQWRFGGVPIAGATASTLVLPNVQLSDIGDYSVLVTNGVGSILSSNATLLVVTPDCVPAPTNIVSWWRAEGDAKDAMRLNNGVIEGNTAFAPGQVGQAFDLSSTNANIRIPASSTLDVGAGNGITLEAWINPASVTNLQPIFEWNSGSSVGDAWGVHFYVSVDPAPGSLYANIVDDGQGWHRISSTNSPLIAGIFRHVALTYDKVAGIATIYCNGQIVAQSSMGSFTPGTTSDLYLGCRPTGELFKYKGLIDEPAIYNRALNQAEIQSIYNSGITGKCVPVYPPVITTQPTNVFTIAGSNITFTVAATGTDPLSYQWSFNTVAIPGATNTWLTISNAQNADEGSYTVIVTNLYGSVTSSNAVLVVDVPPVADASATTALLISVNSSNATVVLDGTLSYDADGDSLHYLWLDAQTNSIGTGVVAVVTLPVTTNAITLLVDDGYVSSSDTISIEVITIAQAVERLESVVNGDVAKKKALLATLNAALAAIDRSNPTAGLNQLHAFQDQVEAQLAPLDPILAQALIDEAQTIIDAIIGGGGVHSHAALTSSLQPNGKLHIKFSGTHQQTYIIEASTNLVDWEKIGLAKEQPDGSFNFDDAEAPQKSARFYRVTIP